MSITFGAVGDIISVALLAKDLIATLDEARGSKAEYRDVVQAINNLNEIIDTVNIYVIQPGLITPELRTLCEMSKQAVARCHDLGGAFLARIGRYQTAFDKTHGTNKLKEVTMAVRWRVGEKEALIEFYAELVKATSSLQTLLAIANFALLNINRKEMNEKFDGAQIKEEITITSQNAALDDIRDGMKTANTNIEAGNSMLTMVSEALKFDWIRQLGSEIKGKMQSVMVINFAIYDAIIRLQDTLPRYLERGISEELITLEDPIGRVAPFSLQWITSWDAFHSALELRFQDMPGQSKMRRRQYALQASGTGREIELSRSWHVAFRPGQRIDMSFVFNQAGAGESNDTTCPGCQTPSTHSNNVDIKCETCQIWFRRITVVQDDDSPLQVTSSRSGQLNRGSALQHEPTATRNRERSLHNVGWYEEEDLTSFKRVRLISQTRRTGEPGPLSIRKREGTGTTVTQTRKAAHIGRAPVIVDECSKKVRARKAKVEAATAEAHADTEKKREETEKPLTLRRPTATQSAERFERPHYRLEASTDPKPWRFSASTDVIARHPRGKRGHNAGSAAFEMK